MKDCTKMLSKNRFMQQSNIMDEGLVLYKQDETSQGFYKLPPHMIVKCDQH